MTPAPHITARAHCAPLLLAAALLLALLAAGGCRETTLPPGVIYTCSEFTLTSDSLVEGPRTLARAPSSLHLVAYKTDCLIAVPPHSYPRATVGMRLPDALYNLAASTLAETPADTTARLSPMAVWLSMAWVDPERSKAALRAQVRDGRVASATSTAWPVDATRAAWLTAAWEVYLATGDTQWLREVYDVGALTLADDARVTLNPDYHLYRGMMAPVAQMAAYYPSWMAPIDASQSMCLWVNALMANNLDVMARAAALLGEDPSGWERLRADTREAVNINLWIPSESRYSQMLYGVFPLQAPVSDARAQAIAVLCDITERDMASRLVTHTPATPYGLPRLYPSMSAGETYYNDRSESLTLSLWALACAKAGSIAPLRHALACQMRIAAMTAGQAAWVDAFTGAPPREPSSRQARLDASAGRLATVLRVIFGMTYTPEGISFAPVVPMEYAAEKLLASLHYRDAELAVVVHGTGTRIARFAIDGKVSDEPLFPASLTGRHTVEVTMASNGYELHEAPMLTAPDTLPAIPTVVESAQGRYSLLSTAEPFVVYTNGVCGIELNGTEYLVPDTSLFSALAFARITAPGGREGYATRAMMWVPGGWQSTAALADSALLSDEGWVATSARINPRIAYRAPAGKGGRYLVSLIYSNAAGDPDTPGEAAMCALEVGGSQAGVMLMPPLGLGQWQRTGRSNWLTVDLPAGTPALELSYLPLPGLQPPDSLAVHLHHLQLIRISPP